MCTPEIRELFRIFDKNHDNTISSGELGKMLRCMGMDVTEAEVATIMKELDKNGQSDRRIERKKREREREEREKRERDG